ncbi:unnamed protein product [Adineta ricciae]|uniref:Uncharacterized protein n=1 Tax=Adineta ricciae TaxID=249248 RepID=A0A815IFT3_ADIRI|nr:unnamed protein product [Adineta ricciae]
MIDLGELSSVNDDDDLADRYIPMRNVNQPASIWSMIPCITTHKRKRMCIIFCAITVILLVLVAAIATPIIIIMKKGYSTTEKSTITTMEKRSTTITETKTTKEHSSFPINSNTKWKPNAVNISAVNGLNRLHIGEVIVLLAGNLMKQLEKLLQDRRIRGM